MDPEVIRQQHAIRVEVHELREKLSVKLPDLAIRIFALRGKHYSGCGFHYSLVASIGGLLDRMNRPDRNYGLEDVLTDEVIFDGLIERVAEIEAELASRGNV
jgi:hypothetical protein